MLVLSHFKCSGILPAYHSILATKLVLKAPENKRIPWFWMESTICAYRNVYYAVELGNIVT